MSSAVPEGWEQSNITGTCDVLDSKRIPLNSQERALRKGAYPYYGANGIQGYIDDFIFEGEHLLLAEDGGYFDEWDSRPISYLVDGRFWVNNHAHILKAKQGNETRYIHYSLVHKNILKHINGGTRAKLNQSDMRDIKFLLPPLPEQKKVASILTSVDEVIEKTESQIAKLQDLKTGMMQELLTKGIGHTEFKDSPVGRIPAGWEVVKTGEISKSIVPGRNKPKSLTGPIPWLTITDLDGIYVKESKAKLGVTREVLSEASGKTIPKNSVIMTVVGEFGTSSVAQCEMVINQQLHGFVCKDDIDPTFLCLSLRHQKLQMERLATQTTIAYMNKDNAESVLFAKPPLDEQKIIVLSIMSVEEKLMAVTLSGAKLKSIKKALMQDLLTGKVRVKTD
jgi:type I restriction enzyme S subunit